MFTLLAAVLTAITGSAYRLRAGSWDMPLWLIAPSIIVPICAAEFTQHLERRRSARLRRAGRTRRAHARTTNGGTP